MRRMCLVCLVCLVCHACALSPQAARIQELPPDQVERCDYLGDVFGTSPNCLFPELPLAASRHAALEQAARLGATNICWVGLAPWVAHGRAYRCMKPSYTHP